jgi:hypothetical protein
VNSEDKRLDVDFFLESGEFFSQTLIFKFGAGKRVAAKYKSKYKK